MVDKGSALETFDWIKITSADGHEFFLDKHVAFECEALKAAYETKRQMGHQGRIELKYEDITGRIMQKVIEYLYYKYKWTDTRQPMPEFPIDDDICLDLLLTANFLGC
mmetsp:Transcript_624/g.985  ORF Transcript_624/g.985 Transcript_624/m.985 type:complete len:108 (+) Transcript_624:59-382(+)